MAYSTYSKDDNDRVCDFRLELEASNPMWITYEESLKQNAWKHYCIDILNERWKGSGDNKLDTIVFDKEYYTRDIDWNSFEKALRQWFDTAAAEKHEYKRVSPPQEPEKMFLSLLYLPVFSAADQVDHSMYDVEHLATKNLMKRCLDKYDGNLKLPIGSIGNLCLLPQKENRSKKEKTIYSDNRYLDRSKYSLQEIDVSVRR